MDAKENAQLRATEQCTFFFQDMNMVDMVYKQYMQ